MIRALFAATVLSVLPASAYTLKLRVKYEDKVYSRDELIGLVPLPVTHAVAEVVAPGSNRVFYGRTTEAGQAEVEISQADAVEVRIFPEAQVDRYDIAVISRTSSESYQTSVRLDVLGNQEAQILIPADHPSARLFNVLDVAVTAIDYLHRADPSIKTELTANQPMTIRLHRGATRYRRSQNLILISIDDAWNDSVIGHEIGHWAQDHFSWDSTNRTSPCPSFHNGSIRLSPACAFSEGWASFFSAAMRRERDPWARFDRADDYGSYFDLESHSDSNGHTVLDTQTSETAVASALWDLVDSPARSGDDEIFDQLEDKDSEIWSALVAMGRRIKNGDTSAGFFRSTLDTWFLALLDDAPEIARSASGTWSRDLDVNGPFEAVGIRFYPDGKFLGQLIDGTPFEFTEPNDIVSMSWNLHCGRDFGPTISDPEFTLVGASSPYLDDSDWFYIVGGAACATCGNWNSVELVRLNPGYFGETRLFDDGAALALELYDQDGFTLLSSVESAPGVNDLQVIAVVPCDFPGYRIRVRRSTKVTEYGVNFGYYALRIRPWP